jgi:putative DNA methylase
MATRREFLTALKTELPKAITDLQRGNIAPVDLAQASIGPGMAIFTRYSQVKESDGSDMPVRTALQLINQVLDETLAQQEGDLDADTRWALAWFSEFGMEEGPYGRAEILSKAKNTSVAGMVDAGILTAGRGKVRLLRRDEMDPEWDPRTDSRLTIWEVTQHLIRALETGGETAAAQLLSRTGGGLGEAARELTYRLYGICERKRWAQEAIAYNTLATAWPEISRLSREVSTSEPQQLDAF